MRVYITNIPPIHKPKDKPDFCIESDVKIESTQDIVDYLDQMSKLLCNRRTPILEDKDLF